MNKTKIIIAILAGLSLSACANLEDSSDSRSSGAKLDQPRPDIICEWGTERFDLCQYESEPEMVKALIEKMTLQEKIGQMTQSVWHNGVNPDIIREQNIGSIIHTQGPTPGPLPLDWINKFDEFQIQALQTRLGIPLMTAVDAVHGQNTFEGAVIFPHNIGMAATRNFDLIQRAAEITAIEMAGTGFNWTFSPCIAMPLHEYWGRVYEGFSEDKDLTISAVSASVKGHQGDDLGLRHTVAATAKHYLGDGATEGGREGGNAIIDEATLRDYHLPPYAQAVNQGIASIMVGFNSVNGINMHQHQDLVANVLKGELGFEGVVLTDWNGGIRYGEPHIVINAGVDVAMQPGNHEEFMSKLTASVNDGTVEMSRIDDAVRRILTMKFNLGLFKDPFGKREFSLKVGSAEHRKVARQAVRESLVLLKSENDVLPLSPSDDIAVIGEHADSTGLQSGGWSINWQGTTESYAGATSIIDGIRSIAPNTEYLSQGCTADMRANTAVVVVGEQPYAEFKGDTDQLWLNDVHKGYIDSCKKLDKSVVVVLISGRTLIIEDDLNKSDAFIAAWLPGSEGSGVADFLFGIDGFTPVGKSPYAWPKSFDDLPLGRFDEKALFPFGYGLTEY
ncbi:glycoside hydrolase family 3 protein [Glaciecola sp. SC05]|uniref:glycoside hydrolase family 3 protein n=1 Tax=Glaciecola sp. SC05 TaxID=1987355 RepID=UPI003527BF04